MGNLARFTAPLRDVDTFQQWNDFGGDQVDTEMVDTVTDSGTVAMGDAVFGTATLTPSDGSVADNDEAYLTFPNENFLFTAGQPIYGRCKLRFTETTATIYNVGAFMMNAATANSLIDNGGGLKLSGSTIGIAKVDGEGVWRAYSANNSVSTTSVSTATAVTATDYVLEWFLEDFSATQMVATFKVNGKYLVDSTSGQVIRHVVTVASSTEMMLGVGCKLGAATNNDTTVVDYIYGEQYRGQGAG